MTNLIDAKNIFELKKEADTKGLKFAAYRDTVEYSTEVATEITYTILDILAYHGFDETNTKLLDDIVFINMYIQAAVDRQLDLENPLIEDMDFIMQEINECEETDNFAQN